MKLKPQTEQTSAEVYESYSGMIQAYTKGDNEKAQNLAQQLLKMPLDSARLKDVIHVLKRLGAV